MRVDGLWVVPGARRLAGVVVVVMGRQHERPGRGNDPPHPADLGDELHEGVLADHGVVEDGRVEGAAVLAGDGAGLGDDRTHGVEDALGRLTRPELVAPQGEHGRMEARIVQREPRRHLPGDVGPQLGCRVAIGEAVEGLEDHDGRHHIRGHRRAAPARREQVGEHLVGKQLAPMVGQEVLDTALRHEVAAQGVCVEQLTIGIRGSLHPPILVDQPANREYHTAICSAVS